MVKGLGSIIRRMVSTWGMALGVIPFTVLFAYGVASVAASARGAVKATLGSGVATIVGVFIASAAIFCGLSAILAWLDEKKAGR